MLFETFHGNRFIAPKEDNLASLIECLKEAAYDLQKMLDAGVYIADGGFCSNDDHYILWTEDEQVAKQFGMTPVDESRFV